ncbi:MAG: SpoIIE family protein phosphatase, partial [Oscillospiraceae bacterium]|nr:SpoIIE family protein phosphatase [Oscillospiraceae bacterium]
MASAQLDTVGWAIVSVVRQKVVMQPTVILQEQYDAITQEAMASYEQSSSASLRTIITLLLTGTLLALIASQMLARRIVKPLELITKRINSLSGSDNAFEMEDTYRTGDEIEILAQSFATLSQRTRTYITQITQITAEKERIGAELDMAASIQANALPNIFPAFPGRKEFDIYATMHPAKEVGGDFYDFFMIGDDHLGIVVADVSGKGVPAALFMMIAKTMLKTQAQTRLSPERVLLEVNAALTEGNDEDMFVTVWLGVLEISTGELTYADAGHEKLLLYQNGEWKFLPKDSGVALAMWDPEDLELMDEKYQFHNET